MKKVFVFIMLFGLLFFVPSAFADEVVSNTVSTVTTGNTSPVVSLSNLFSSIPNVSQSVMYSMQDYEMKYGTSFTLVSFYKDYVKIDLGYVPTTEVIGILSVKLFNIGEYVKIPLLEYIQFEPFIYGGIQNIDAVIKEDYGVGVKLLSVNF